MSQKNRSLWITLYFITIFQCCFSNDIITQNQSFKDGDILVSSGNNFAFGFFRPGNSQNGYVGIWYNKISVQTVVWVANRDNPIINGSSHGVLSIENSGNLVLRDQTSNMPIWSTQVSGTSTGNSYFVQLLDTGNLVLCEGDQNTPSVLWESFHYPTDTLLPYMKQGMNRTSGLLWSLTSWKSQDDPGTGDCQLKVILNGTPQFYLYKNSERERVWRAGPWNGIQLSGVPDMPTSTTFNGSYVENSEEIGLLFGIRDPSVISKLTVKESGIVERLTWQEGLQSWVRYWVFPRDSCDYYSHCGSFSNCNPYKLGEFECQCLPGYEPKVESEWNQRDGTNGCRRNPGEPTCGNISAHAAFIAITSAKVPDTSNAVVNKILELNECADLCLKNCSCTAYASANISNGGNGCITWYGDLIDMRQFPNTGQDVYIKVSASELARYLKSLKGASNYRKKLMIILIPSTVGILFLVFAIWLALWKRKGQGHAVSSSTEEIDENGDLSLFDLKTIISVTNGFAYDNKLGEGGFGSVYKGQLDDGREVAIKRLSNNSGQGIEEFKNEVRLIAKLQHRNLVKLLGCCIQQEEKMLVYEYLPNKGLDNFIFDKEKGALLDWQKRLDIILGIARGIVYLHRDSRLKIIHRDLKASNVLLDAKMEPKISDFGLARIVNADQMEAKTHRVVGTYGYMSPEYAMQGLFSEKSDVFSYGVLLLEIISGKKNNGYFSDNTVNLIGYAWELWKNGKSLDIVDPSIAMGDSGNLGEIGRCIHTSLLCVQEYARDRPTMSEVLSMLSNETSIPLTYPKQPAFVIKKVNYKKDNISSSSSYLRAFMDYITITIVEPP